MPHVSALPGDDAAAEGRVKFATDDGMVSSQEDHAIDFF
jgi:hypothetical protein